MYNEKIIVFTDLDGTLLNHSTYSYGEAEKALKLLRERKIPLVLCSSKSSDEIKVYREKLSNHEPFISENGGAIYIPEEYGLNCDFDRVEDGYLVIQIGSEYKNLLDVFERVKKNTGINLKSIKEFTLDELISLTGLSKEEACLAQKREFILPFIIDGEQADVENVKREIQSLGFNYTEGIRFVYLMDRNDKGKAVRMLVDIFRKNFPVSKYFTVGLGDSLNDLPMLEAVDKAILVQKKSGSYDERIKVDGLVYADGIGPIGWNKAILGLFSRYHFAV